MTDNENIIEFPKRFSTPEEALESAKDWDFETVFILGHTKEGGSDEGGTIIVSEKKGAQQTAKDLFFIAEICKHTAIKLLRY